MESPRSSLFSARSKCADNNDEEEAYYPDHHYHHHLNSEEGNSSNDEDDNDIRQRTVGGNMGKLRKDNNYKKKKKKRGNAQQRLDHLRVRVSELMDMFEEHGLFIPLPDSKSKIEQQEEHKKKGKVWSNRMYGKDKKRQRKATEKEALLRRIEQLEECLRQKQLLPQQLQDNLKYWRRVESRPRAGISCMMVVGSVFAKAVRCYTRTCFKVRAVAAQQQIRW